MNTLFGMPLAALFAAIAQVESDRGATSENVYQIRDVYVADVNRIVQLQFDSGLETREPIPFAYEDVYDQNKAEKMMLVYWRYYGAKYMEETGREVTYEVLARIHNGGPRGWRKEATWPYWQKVLKELNDYNAR